MLKVIEFDVVLQNDILIIVIIWFVGTVFPDAPATVFAPVKSKVVSEVDWTSINPLRKTSVPDPLGIAI